MAEVRKAIIQLADMPGRDPLTGVYTLRFRLLTKDKNKVSEWSTPITVNPPSPEQMTSFESIESTIVFSNSSGTDVYTLIWTIPEVLTKFSYFDVFIDWNNSGEYSFYKRTGESSISIIPPAGLTVSSIGVLLQVPTSPRSVSDLATIFEHYQEF